MTNSKLTKSEVKQYSPLTMAFLGDAVYEQLVREKLVIGANMPIGKLHNLSVRIVCASFQSMAVEHLLPILTEEEVSIYKRGRNASGNHVPKSASAVDYRRATALECLFGYLSLLQETERINELFSVIWECVLNCERIEV